MADSDPKAIWLGPSCEADSSEGRTWSEEKHEHCNDCDLSPIKYVRADLVLKFIDDQTADNAAELRRLIGVRT